MDINYIFAPLLIAATLLFYWGLIVFLRKMNWPRRYGAAIFGFMLFAPCFLIVFWGSQASPGGEILLLFPFGGAFIGSVVGLIADLVNK